MLLARKAFNQECLLLCLDQVIQVSRVGVSILPHQLFSHMSNGVDNLC